MALERNNVLTAVIGRQRKRHAVPTVDGKISLTRAHRTLCGHLISGAYVYPNRYQPEIGQSHEAFPDVCRNCVREIGKTFPSTP